MLEIARESNTVVRQMLFLANNYNVVFSPLDIVLD
jgi:hypothetical protein